MSQDKPVFEEQLARLTRIVSALEEGTPGLEEGVVLYKEGLELVQSCRRRLAEARNEVKVYQDGLLREFESPDEEGAGSPPEACSDEESMDDVDGG
jgi:exodeoxyribonuclease VII small subunit